VIELDPDLFLVIGLVIGVLTVPAMLSAFSEGRTPRAAAIMLLIAGVLVVMALGRYPDGYSIADIPNAFVRVFDRYIN
jgi:hypothetical protein